MYSQIIKTLKEDKKILVQLLRKYKDDEQISIRMALEHAIYLLKAEITLYQKRARKMKVTKDGKFIATIEANSSAQDTALITDNVIAKALLRRVFEYFGNDFNAVFSESKLIYARMQAIADVNEIVADGDKLDEAQFDALVTEKLCLIHETILGARDVTYNLKLVDSM